MLASLHCGTTPEKLARVHKKNPKKQSIALLTVYTSFTGSGGENICLWLQPPKPNPHPPNSALKHPEESGGSRSLASATTDFYNTLKLTPDVG